MCASGDRVYWTLILQGDSWLSGPASIPEAPRVCLVEPSLWCLVLAVEASTPELRGEGFYLQLLPQLLQGQDSRTFQMCAGISP
jgi:hypothetical protein